jgi:hypothetical protein
MALLTVNRITFHNIITLLSGVLNISRHPSTAACYWAAQRFHSYQSAEIALDVNGQNKKPLSEVLAAFCPFITSGLRAEAQE